jgi:hypothetical protein
MLKEHDALTGLTTTVKCEDGQMRVNYSQDNTELYERLQKLRNAEDYSKQGIKNNLWHAITISPADCMKLIVEDGIDPYTCSAKELRQHLTRNRSKWGHLFATAGQV